MEYNMQTEQNNSLTIEEVNAEIERLINMRRKMGEQQAFSSFIFLTRQTENGPEVMLDEFSNNPFDAFQFETMMEVTQSEYHGLTVEEAKEKFIKTRTAVIENLQKQVELVENYQVEQ
jgi:hypothetical protein